MNGFGAIEWLARGGFPVGERCPSSLQTRIMWRSLNLLTKIGDARAIRSTAAPQFY
jgi:hypothetical protein